MRKRVAAVFLLLLTVFYICLTPVFLNSRWQSKGISSVSLEALPADNEMLSFMGIRAEDGVFTSWTGPFVYHLRQTVGTDVYEYWSIPYGAVSVPDRVSGANTAWQSVFSVRERMTINGVPHTERNSAIRYRNVAIQTDAGESAALIQQLSADNTRDFSSDLTSRKILTGWLQFTLSAAIPHTGAAIWAFQAYTAGQSRERTASAYLPAGTFQSAYRLEEGKELCRDYYHEDGHYIVVQDIAVADGSPGDHSTASVQFSWEVWSGGEYFQTDNQTVHKAYTCK